MFISWIFSSEKPAPARAAASGATYVQALSADDNPTGYLFRCLQCGTHRLHTDGT